MSKRNLMAGFWVAVATFTVGCGSGLSRLQKMDADASGYAMYRSGQPESEDLEELCTLGVKRIFALNGHGDRYAETLKQKCPGVEVVYNVAQEPGLAVDAAFLQKFDDAVAQAKAEGTGILFHCSCGCHRTGRLAAYYRMKHNGWNFQDAYNEMMTVGDKMDHHPYLYDQVVAMSEYLQGQPCTQQSQYCINPPAGAPVASAGAAQSTVSTQ